MIHFVCVVLCCVVLCCVALYCFALSCGLLVVCFWFGLVWFGLVWFGLVWFGLVRCGLVWFGLVTFCLVYFGVFFTSRRLALVWLNFPRFWPVSFQSVHVREKISYPGRLGHFLHSRICQSKTAFFD